MTEIATRGGGAILRQADVSVADDVEQLVTQTIETYGRLDFAVNNAGFEGEVAPIFDYSEEMWDQVLGSNLKGTFLSMKYEIKAMIRAGNGGAIVNVGSVNSFVGCPGLSPYVASKHGMVGLTTSVSAEVAPMGIRVNIVCPGIIDTPMHRRGRELFGDTAYDNMIQQSLHIRRAGRPEEVAKCIVLFCTEEASYITGTTLTPDGGYLATR